MKTHRTFGKLFEPYGFEHTVMSNIRKGELVEPFNLARFGLEPKNPESSKLLETEVEDEFQRWKNVHKNNISYIAIDMSEVDEDAYVLQAFLTTDGEQAIEALERGFVWDRDDRAPSMPGTISYYEDKIKRGIIGEKVWGPITSLARKYVEFRPLRARIVYLRMQGDMTNGRIRPPLAVE